MFTDLTNRDVSSAHLTLLWEGVAYYGKLFLMLSPLFNPIFISTEHRHYARFISRTAHKDNLDAAEEFTQGRLDLATSGDPEIRDYFEKRDRFKLLPSWRHAEGGRLSHVTHRKSQYKAMILS